jgi:hypothetical protein
VLTGDSNSTREGQARFAAFRQRCSNRGWTEGYDYARGPAESRYAEARRCWSPSPPDPFRNEGRCRTAYFLPIRARGADRLIIPSMKRSRLWAVVRSTANPAK